MNHACYIIKGEDGIRDGHVTGVQTCALPISIGKLLYVCLAGRWPGGRIDGLKAAPTEHGRLLRPRQVRAGVSRDVDTVCDRILGTPPRHGEEPLRTARGSGHERTTSRDA